MLDWEMSSDRASTPRPRRSPRPDVEWSAASPAGLLSTSSAIIALQRSAGNRATAGLLAVQRRGCDATCGCGGSASCAGQEREAEPEFTRQPGHRPGRAFLQRQVYGPEASGAPADWETRVKALAGGGGTAIDRFKLVDEALGSGSVVTLSNRTNQDKTIDPTKFVGVGSGKPNVNYDDNLNSKAGPSSEGAGFTRQTARSQIFVFLGPKALRETDFFWTRMVLSHEFDHVRQLRSSTKTNFEGKEDEVDAWTTGFIRDFRRSYNIIQKGTACYIDKYQTFSQLAGYYQHKSVRQSARDNSVKRIVDYFNSNLKGYGVITAVFALWLERGSKSPTPNLANDVQAKLPDVVPKYANGRQIDCADAQAAKYPSPPVIDVH